MLGDDINLLICILSVIGTSKLTDNRIIWFTSIDYSIVYINS